MKIPVKKPEQQCMFSDNGFRCIKNTRNGGRGMCSVHYGRFWSRVKRGVITWEKLERKGLSRKVLPAYKK